MGGEVDVLDGGNDGGKQTGRCLGFRIGRWIDDGEEAV